MKHIFQKSHNKIATILVGFDAGARAESDKYSPGMAHMLEHMMFKGTAKRNYLELPRQIAFLGGDSNAFTSHEMVCYYITLPYENLEAGMEILSDMVLHSTFPEEEFLKEKEVVLEECLSAKDEVTSPLNDAYSENFWSGRLATSIIGTEESIKGFTHGELLKFYREFYDTNSAILAVSGDLDPEHVAELSKKYFGPETSFVRKTAPDNFAFKSGRTVEISRDSLEHNYVYISYPGLNVHQETDAAFDILSEVFGSGMDSRLFTEVREKNNLCYSIGAHNSAYLEAGSYNIFSSTRAENLDKMLALIDSEVAKIKTELISEEELTRAKNKVKAHVYSTLDSGRMKLMDTFNRVFFNLPSFDEVVSKINQVTREDVLTLANRIFDEDKKMIFVLNERGE